MAFYQLELFCTENTVEMKTSNFHPFNLWEYLTGFFEQDIIMLQ